ncbi:DUF4242 domain-containing protein [Salinisphaera orenii]|uniref:DUF4242 domain-containing protein n=1 Tax=Salinisphaera orenii YIM 95161 TaxID=1051139 RepID=A0A423Q9Q2_9GAMM|nr:DUF4242 domain-containing protein [Salinisphaera halophila]ROO37159.1 hypothetical protein SAHL_01685 [Salinisphaera halophila YIM 95161]
MPLFLIERNFADQLELSADTVREVTQINAEVGTHWLFSFLSADKKKTYCLYEASSAEAIGEAARRAGLPADLVIEVDKVNPQTFA